MPPDHPAAPPAGPRVALALQGGGSHGAFTWGVLDRLLEDDGLPIGAISGTSAGALNAAVLATGHARGGRPGARAALAAFWRDVSASSHRVSFFPAAAAAGSPWFASLARAFSPYELNPLNLNPLRDLLGRHVDAAALRESTIPLFVTATAVHSGQARVFTGHELGLDALLASACLPFVFQAVEIDGEPYWDGGYTGNPAIYPLIDDAESLDILVVRINPLQRLGTPRRSVEIVDRVGEIGFNASLLSELRAIAFVSRLVREGKLDPGRYRDLRLHEVADDDGLAPHGAASKFNTEPGFLDTLFGLGRQAADGWLRRHSHDVGVRATLDLERGFLARSGRAEGGRRIAPEAPAASAAPGRLRRLWAALTGRRGT